MPGRSRGTQTRSAPAEIVQVTGVDIEDYADKPIMLTTIHRDYKSK